MSPFTAINSPTPPRATEVPDDIYEPHSSAVLGDLNNEAFAAVCWYFGKPEEKETPREKRERMMRMFKRIVACRAELDARELKSDKIAELAGVPPPKGRDTVNQKLSDREWTAIRSYFTQCKNIWESDKTNKGDVNAKVDLGNEFFVERDSKHHNHFLERFEYYKRRQKDIPVEAFPTTSA